MARSKKTAGDTSALFMGILSLLQAEDKMLSVQGIKALLTLLEGREPPRDVSMFDVSRQEEGR